MTTSEQTIRAQLAEMESALGVRVLHAVESGSRAWGFASPDSDYDVRFIYVRDIGSYLRLERTRDVIEWQLDDVFDINGWDLAKALRLLRTSNPTLYEWRDSPIVYATAPDWTIVTALFEPCFSPKKSLYHYLSTARSNAAAYLRGDRVKLKKYFYVIRPLLAGRWVVERDAPPPMPFADLVSGCLPEALGPVVAELLVTKTVTSELGLGPRLPEVDRWIEAELVTLGDVAAALPDRAPCDWALLDEAFRTVLGL